MSEFKFSCPQCGQHLACDESMSGSQIQCPACQGAIVVPPRPRAVAVVRPQLSQPSSSPPPPLPEIVAHPQLSKPMTSSPPPPRSLAQAPVEKRSPSGKGLGIAAIVFVLVVGSAAFLWTRFRNPNSTAQLNRKIEAIRAAGYPVNATELNAWYPTPATEQNAAIPVDAAISALVPPDRNSPGLPTVLSQLPAASGPLPHATKQAIAEYVQKNQRALELLHAAVVRKEARYPVDLSRSFEALLPHLAKIKTCSQLLMLEAVLHADNGRAAEAADSILAGLSLARSLEKEPLLISQLVRIACLAICQGSLEYVLNRIALNNEALTGLHSALQQAEQSDGLARAFAGERALQIDFFQLPLEKQLAIFKSDSTNSSQLTGYRNTKAYLADFDFCLTINQELIASTRLPFPESLEAGERLARRVQRDQIKQFVLSSMLLPALTGTVAKEAQNAANLRLAQAAVAIERYRPANGGALPAKLETLTPGLLASVPLDPFSRGPLRYTLDNPRQYTLYSVGTDKQDDRGRKRKTGESSGFDLVFSVSR